MKTDNYLNLCLEQASKSPLHYRHGCIIVRGGKVIGQGYNDYRPGFNGGALKSGRLAAGKADGPAILELKQKLKQKSEQAPEPGHVDLNGQGTFTAFESMTGAGPISNVPLSMHSEMMAIHSAINASSKFGSSAFSYQKPCFKLSGDSKRKARLRQQALEQYVERLCGASAGTSKLQVQECGFEPGTSQPGQSVPVQQRQQHVPGKQRRGVSRRQEWGETLHVCREVQEEDEGGEREAGSSSRSQCRFLTTAGTPWTTTTPAITCI